MKRGRLPTILFVRYHLVVLLVIRRNNISPSPSTRCIFQSYNLRSLKFIVPSCLRVSRLEIPNEIIVLSAEKPLEKRLAGLRMLRDAVAVRPVKLRQLLSDMNSSHSFSAHFMQFRSALTMIT